MMEIRVPIPSVDGNAQDNNLTIFPSNIKFRRKTNIAWKVQIQKFGIRVRWTEA